MNCDQKEEGFNSARDQIQVLVILLSIFGLLLTLYIVILTSNLRRNNITPSQAEQIRILRLSELVTTIFVIVALYFAIRAYEDLKSNPTRANQLFFIATIFILIGVLIRFYVVRRIREAQLQGAEDIV